MKIKESPLSINMHKPVIFLFSVTLFSCLLFEFASRFQDTFKKLVSVATYLTWHNMFEFVGILVCFAIFIVSYYTYDQTRRLRLIFLGCALLTAGLVDTFHTLSFEGMPAFFIENVSANRATTFWIIARLIAALGFLIASFIPFDREAAISKYALVIPAFLAAFAVLLVVTYYPQFLPAMFIEGTGLTQVKIYLEYFIIILLAFTAIRFIAYYIKTGDYLSVLMSGAMLLGVFSELAFVSYSRVYDIYNYIGHIYKFISYFIIFRVVFVRNVQQPYSELSAAQKELKGYADNLDKVVEQRTKQLKQLNGKLLDDLEYAKDIQKAMLPSILPDNQNVSFSARYFPADRLSGDFYDIFKLDDRHIGLYICDVSGHGVPAAMLTVFLKQCIEARMEVDMNTGRMSSPSTVLHNVYESFNHTNFKEDVYIVLFYAIYDISSKKLVYSSAGMNVPPMVTSKDGEVREIGIRGLPICKFKGIFAVEYQDSSVVLNSGDRMLFYTDGLVEAQNREQQQFSSERLLRVLGENSSKTGDEMTQALMDELHGFIQDVKIRDDVTFFMMEIK